MASNLQILLDHRPTDKVSPANFRIVETPDSDAGAGRGAGASSLPVARPLHARAAQRREILRQAAGDRRGDGRRHGRRVVEASNNPRFKAGDAVVGMGGWQLYSLSDGATLQGRRRQGDPDPGLSRPGRHARRHRLVRPEQDHRAEDRARRCSFRRRPARSARSSASSPSSPARGRSASPAARRNAPTPSRNSATTPASTTSRRISPRS